jgi:hypothetical protein
MSSARQTDRPGNVRARLYCGKCGCHLQRFEVWPEIGDALPRVGGPSNPSRRVPRSAYEDRNLPAGTPDRPPDKLHHYPCECGCECGGDWKSGSYRLGAAILAKARATGRSSVRLVTGDDI